MFLNCRAVLISWAFRRREYPGPMPQISSIGVWVRVASISEGDVRITTPLASVDRLARRLANLASVFVGPIPMDTGIPVHCWIVARIDCPYAVKASGGNGEHCRNYAGS